MQMSDSGSDAEMEVDEVNQKLQDENDDNEGEEEKLEPEDEEEEAEAEQEDAPESEEASPPPSPPKQPRLKIKLKLPSVPSTEDTASRGHSGDINVEPEDEDDEGEAVGSTRPMTSRQAVLASVVGSSHVSLCSELALRREETARKGHNLTEKKSRTKRFAETINRLLKKHALSTAEASASEGEREVEQEEEVVLLTPWRWVSSTPPLADLSTMSQNDVAQGKMHLTLGVPISPPLPKEKPQCDVPGCTET
ncbi:hypothetical protein DFJ58DRAFT_810910 [Suillus subalutaceus]|uniref:uncharacterized protein n=1 Tax=Suillus subalutaceus TaxID=48586 RepID=UPI001B85EAA9|nr:uncharacterized protein DFJ58DRAFT_810910 [Suillus subalutaceus]KAG1840163.1 hypothetical protein DFJ58DRAFT_810910 [Suillus subalutaceus]